MTGSSNFEKFGNGKKNNYEFSEWKDRQPKKKRNKQERGRKRKEWIENE